MKKKPTKKATSTPKKATTTKKGILRGKTKRKKSKFNRAGHRSGLETKVATWLADNGITFQYEGSHIPYTMPAVKRKYTPDFWLDSKTFIEVKGRLDLATRKKMEQIRAQNPGMTMIMAFGKPSNKLYKGSKTSYADWADKNGFLWCSVDSLDLILKERANES